MADNFAVRGSIPEVIRNEEGLYEGDLIYYARIIFQQAQNINNPYHNLRHLLHVVWLCYQACRYYQAQLTMRQRRNLMIGAMFHDYDHPGRAGHDDLNIERAVRGLRAYISDEDLAHLPDIEQLMRATEYPHQGETARLELSQQIMRDADLLQVMSVSWIQQILGLAVEWQQSPRDVLLAQTKFLQTLKLHTDWAQELCPPDKIADKQEEVRQLIEIFI